MLKLRSLPPDTVVVRFPPLTSQRVWGHTRILWAFDGVITSHRWDRCPTTNRRWGEPLHLPLRNRQNRDEKTPWTSLQQAPPKRNEYCLVSACCEKSHGLRWRFLKDLCYRRSPFYQKHSWYTFSVLTYRPVPVTRLDRHSVDRAIRLGGYVDILQKGTQSGWDPLVDTKTVVAVECSETSLRGTRGPAEGLLYNHSRGRSHTLTNWSPRTWHKWDTRWISGWES